ncbi:uncharacterized protein LOC128342688 [Hemicordylus capensis]|uniref:uncharacterized protein LOC128342688 n=1 Tax=Hemicordylus capensis TaxID=884348 RepID=UPI002302555D|nr:uncharacterized protein LOC128342688 [Hemicordylus capensis]XP_053146367.1 uncharacterized protein LOC128342688 [Hemicordylus capensis]
MAQQQLVYAATRRDMDTSDYDSAVEPNTSEGSVRVVKRKHLSRVNQVAVELPEIIITEGEQPGEDQVSKNQGDQSVKGCSVNQVAVDSGIITAGELPAEPNSSEGRVRPEKRKHLGLSCLPRGHIPLKKSKNQGCEESEQATDANQQIPENAKVAKFAKELIAAGEALVFLMCRKTECKKIIAAGLKRIERLKQCALFITGLEQAADADQQSPENAKVAKFAKEITAAGEGLGFLMRCKTEFQNIVAAGLNSIKRIDQCVVFITESIARGARNCELPGMVDFVNDIKKEFMYPCSNEKCTTKAGRG